MLSVKFSCLEASSINRQEAFSSHSSIFRLFHKNEKREKAIILLLMIIALPLSLQITSTFVVDPSRQTYSLFSISDLYESDAFWTEFYDPESPKIAQVDPIVDTNGNKLHDYLEAWLDPNKVALYSEEVKKRSPLVGEDRIEIVIDLLVPPNDRIVEDLRSIEGIEILNTHSRLVYTVYAIVPIAQLETLASKPYVELVEPNARSEAYLDTSTSLIGAKNNEIVNTYPVKGNPNTTIAIIDTGIDTSHTDLSNVIYFVDFTGKYANGTTGTDYGHHGTHCASIAAGQGLADTDATNVPITFSGKFPDVASSYYHWFQVKDNPSAATTTVTLYWDDSAGGTVWLNIIDSSDNAVTSWVSGTTSPLTVSASLTSGWYWVYAEPGTTEFSKNYTIEVSAEYTYFNTSQTSGPVFSGVAPESKLIALKVLNDTGSGTSDWLLNALDWVSLNGALPQYNITVISMSLGFDTRTALGDAVIPIPSIDTAVNNLVLEGFVVVCAAGNSGTNLGANAVSSPALAELSIAVAAGNDAYEVTHYSSVGDFTNASYNYKPDLVAPGGTAASTGTGSPHNLIIAADSNSGDPHDDYDTSIDEGAVATDYFLNDYRGMQGTSMACPHVAGAAQLVIDALMQKNNWNSWVWSQENALKVKQLLLMSTFELNAAETYNEGDNVSIPISLDRTGKDEAEGWGFLRVEGAIHSILASPSEKAYSVNYSLDKRNETYAFTSKVIINQFEGTAAVSYVLNLSVPATGDFDILIFNGTPSSAGEPVVLASSTNAGLGADESLVFTPTETGTYYVAIRVVEGYGDTQFTFQSSDSSLTTTPEKTIVVGSNMDSSVIEATLTVEGAPFAGASITITTDLGSLNATSAVTDNNGKIYVRFTGEPIVADSLIANVSFSSTVPTLTTVQQITIIKNNFPVLSSPADVTILENETIDPILSWDVSDGEISASATYNITLNGTLQVEGTWNSNTTIQYTFTNRTVGTYICSLNVDDGYGLVSTDEIVVTVLPVPSDTDTTTNDTTTDTDTSTTTDSGTENTDSTTEDTESTEETTSTDSTDSSESETTSTSQTETSSAANEDSTSNSIDAASPYFIMGIGAIAVLAITISKRKTLLS